MINDYLNNNLLDFVKTFKIKKGKRRAIKPTMIFGMNFYLPSINFTTNSLISVLGCFDKSCLYLNRGINKFDINIFYGISLSIFQSNYANLGWRCTDNKNIELLTYIVSDNERMEEQVLLTIQPGVWFSFKMIIKEDRVIYNLKSGDDTAMVSIKINKKPSWIKRVIYPTIVSEKTMVKDISIKILEK